MSLENEMDERLIAELSLMASIYFEHGRRDQAGLGPAPGAGRAGDRRVTGEAPARMVELFSRRVPIS